MSKVQFLEFQGQNGIGRQRVHSKATGRCSEEQNALAEFRRSETTYYGRIWAEATDKVKRLEAQISKRKAR